MVFLMDVRGDRNLLITRQDGVECGEWMSFTTDVIQKKRRERPTHTHNKKKIHKEPDDGGHASSFFFVKLCFYFKKTLYPFIFFGLVHLSFNRGERNSHASLAPGRMSHGAPDGDASSRSESDGDGSPCDADGTAVTDPSALSMYCTLDELKALALHDSSGVQCPYYTFWSHPNQHAYIAMVCHVTDDARPGYPGCRQDQAYLVQCESQIDDLNKNERDRLQSTFDAIRGQALVSEVMPGGDTRYKWNGVTIFSSVYDGFEYNTRLP
jgi:hypothetical protein